MAEMLDGVSDSQEVFSEIDAVEQELKATDPIEEKIKDKSVLDSLPEKYRGKKVEDIIKSYEEAEKKASRLGNEVYEVRQLADELIKTQLARKAEVEQPKEVDFFENPQEAIRQAIGNDPRLKTAEAQAVMAQRAMALQTLASKHPDYRDVDADSEFKAWVGGSRVRQSLYNAAQNYDVDAADELISTYKQLNAAKVQRDTQAETKSREKSLNSVAVDSSGTGETTRKVYRRADIMNLMIRDPAKYEAMQNEFARAYEEGRVR